MRGCTTRSRVRARRWSSFTDTCSTAGRGRGAVSPFLADAADRVDTLVASHASAGPIGVVAGRLRPARCFLYQPHGGSGESRRRAGDRGSARHPVGVHAGRRPPGLEGSGFSALRLFLWLPYCGLFVSLFFAVGGDDRLDLLRYLGLVAGAAAIGVAIAVNLIYRGAVFTNRFVNLVMVPFAWITLGLGMLSAAIGTR